jgi:hypothetical protein
LRIEVAVAMNIKMNASNVQPVHAVADFFHLHEAFAGTLRFPEFAYQ